MRVAIIGDSFTHTFKDTWIEQVVDYCGLEVYNHIGFAGHSEYKIYQHFLTVVEQSIPDMIIIVHTERSRLYNKNIGINPAIVEISLDKNAKQEIIDAAKMYYEHLYDDEYAKTIYNLLVRDMQEICKTKNIKMVNIPAFEYDFIEKKYGLWILTQNGGLVEASHTDVQNNWNTQIPDTRLNHFSPKGHNILAENIKMQINTCLNSEQELQIALIYPEIFA